MSKIIKIEKTSPFVVGSAEVLRFTARMENGMLKGNIVVEGTVNRDINGNVTTDDVYAVFIHAEKDEIHDIVSKIKQILCVETK